MNRFGDDRCMSVQDGSESVVVTVNELSKFCRRIKDKFGVLNVRYEIVDLD